MRFGLLQAGHYGTPQDRVRFFLNASLHGYPLPALPQPSHSSLSADGLQLALSNEVNIRPILTAKGTAPLKHVTIREAIGDLLQWDWYVPSLFRPYFTRLHHHCIFYTSLSVSVVTRC